MTTPDRSRFQRDYAPVLAMVRDLPADASREQRMKAVCDAIWEQLGGEGPGREISWIGFYGIAGDQSEMTLLERRDKPACSPIGLHGACGRAWRERQTLIVDDVKTLGEDYVACDPRDRSELVIPCFEEDGTCWGVLDADSFEIDAFDERDATYLAAAVQIAGASSILTYPETTSLNDIELHDSPLLTLRVDFEPSGPEVVMEVDFILDWYNDSMGTRKLRFRFSDCWDVQAKLGLNFTGQNPIGKASTTEEDPRIDEAHRFLQSNGVAGIPRFRMHRLELALSGGPIEIISRRLLIEDVELIR